MDHVESSEEAIDAIQNARIPKARGIRTGLTLLGMFCLIVFMLLVPIPIGGRTAIALGNLAHAPLFGMIALGILLLLRVQFNDLLPIGVVFFVAVSVFLFGVGIEIVQSLSGRMAAVHDAVANGLGIIAAVVSYYAIAMRRTAPWTSGTLALVAVGILAIAWRPPLTVLHDAAKAKWQFPTLASFESKAEFGRFYFNRCEPSLVQKDTTDGLYAMEVNYSTATKYTGARLIEIQPDWSRAESLELDVILDKSYSGESFEMMIRVVDRREIDGHRNDDHYRRTIELKPGEQQHVSITRQELIDGPKERKLDLRSIVGIDLIVIQPAENVRIRFDAIRLVLQD
jgi:hypothetical protein